MTETVSEAAGFAATWDARRGGVSPTFKAWFEGMSREEARLIAGVQRAQAEGRLDGVPADAEIVPGTSRVPKRRKEYLGWVAKFRRGGYWTGRAKPGPKRQAIRYLSAEGAILCIEDQAKAVRLYRWVKDGDT